MSNLPAFNELFELTPEWQCQVMYPVSEGLNFGSTLVAIAFVRNDIHYWIDINGLHDLVRLIVTLGLRNIDTRIVMFGQERETQITVTCYEVPDRWPMGGPWSGGKYLLEIRQNTKPPKARVALELSLASVQPVIHLQNLLSEALISLRIRYPSAL